MLHRGNQHAVSTRPGDMNARLREIVTGSLEVISRRAEKQNLLSGVNLRTEGRGGATLVCFPMHLLLLECKVETPGLCGPLRENIRSAQESRNVFLRLEQVMEEAKSQPALRGLDTDFIARRCFCQAGSRGKHVMLHFG